MAQCPPPVLWSSPCQAQEGFLLRGFIRPMAFCCCWKPLRWLQLEAEKAVPVSPCPLRGITSVWAGSRSCSHAQGVADRQHWGQEGIFPRGRLAPVPGGFLPSSEH